MAALVLEKCEPENVRAIWIERMSKQWKRMRSKMVKVLDNYYFKEMKGEELEKHIASSIHIRHDVTDMKKAEKLMSEQ